MDFANIILIILLLLIIFWVITKIFFTTNIVYDIILNANERAKETGIVDSFSGNNSNVIKNSRLLENNTANFMLSVWFYIDNWGNNIGKEKNILFVGNSDDLQTHPDLQTTSVGISKKVCGLNDVQANRLKNFSISLDNYENVLNIDIETLPPRSDDSSGCFTRYAIKNVPIQKWNCLTVSVDTKTMDVYLDGKLRNSFILHGTYRSELANNLKKNIYLGNINPSSNNIGFEGFITRIRFEPNSINPKEAYSIYKEGINASLAKSIFNKYSLKVSFLEYNKERGSFII